MSLLSFLLILAVLAALVFGIAAARLLAIFRAPAPYQRDILEVTDVDDQGVPLPRSGKERR